MLFNQLQSGGCKILYAGIWLAESPATTYPYDLMAEQDQIPARFWVTCQFNLGESIPRSLLVWNNLLEKTGRVWSHICVGQCPRTFGHVL